MTARRPIPDVRWRYFSDSVLASLPFAKVQRQNTREIDWPGATDRMALLEGHAAVQYRECIYVFGGRDNVTGRLTNAVWQIPLGDFAAARDAAEVAAKLARQRAATVSVGSAAAGVEPSGSLASPGGPPAAVDYAAATGLPTVRGTAVACSGHVPSPRAFHASCARGHFMLVVGGVTAADPGHAADGAGDDAALRSDLLLHALNLDTMVWSKYYLPGRPAIHGGGGAPESSLAAASGRVNVPQPPRTTPADTATTTPARRLHRRRWRRSRRGAARRRRRRRGRRAARGRGTARPPGQATRRWRCGTRRCQTATPRGAR